MTRKTLYTAIGHFVRRTNGCGRSCPVVLLSGQEYMMDMQEMILWTSLNWRILRREEIGAFYEKTTASGCFSADRTWEMCVDRLLTRGLLVCGSGETEYDALYDLLGSLSIIPTSGSFGLRCLTFLKLVTLDRVPFTEPVSSFNLTGARQRRHRSCSLPGRHCFPLQKSSNVWKRTSAAFPMITHFSTLFTTTGILPVTILPAL